MHLGFQTELINQRFLTAQFLAFTVWELFPKVSLVGGGVNSIGFFFDFIFDQPITDSMLELIEVHLHRFIKERHPVRFIQMMRENAQALFEHHHHGILAQRVGQESSNILELMQVKDFYGLCPPSSITSTEEVGYVKLLEIKDLIQDIQGEQVQITRFIGTSRQSSKDLKIFLKNYEAFLKKKDHRSLGPRLNLFNLDEQSGTLGVTWHPKGLDLQKLLRKWLALQLPELERQISTPIALGQDSLNSDSLAINPFIFDGHEYHLRSSPLQQHLNFLKNDSGGFGELPWKVTEYAQIYRYYPEFLRWGLFCHCSFLTDFTTICCLKEQVISELISSLHFIEQIITLFGFKAQWYLIASRQKSPKARQEQEAIGWLKQAIQSNPKDFSFFSEIQEEEGECEGPRLELRIRDVIGREWPASVLSVIQHGKEAQFLSVEQLEEQPTLIILTRQIWGSLDRFIALLIERYEGVFPLWLAPEQVRIIAIGEANRAYAREVARSLQLKGLRVGLDLRRTKLGIRVHEAEKENIPYLILLGEQERIKQRISVRSAGRFNQNQSIDLETFLNKLYHESLFPGLREREAMLKGESESA